jgi:hypothetical protein
MLADVDHNSAPELSSPDAKKESKVKDWDRIARELSSPDSSDAEDGLNVISVQKNARRVSEILHSVLPESPFVSPDASPPMGMNRFSALRDQLTKAYVESQHLSKHPSTHEPSTKFPHRPKKAPSDGVVRQGVAITSAALVPSTESSHP